MINPAIYYLSGLKSSTIAKPTVTITAVSNSPGTGVYNTKFTGNVDSGTGITESGFCWYTLPNPNIGNFIQLTSPVVTSGLMELDITSNIEESTTYYVRAYAINAGGIGYSATEIWFTSLPSEIQIGEQVWQTKNTDISKYRDGTDIYHHRGTNASWGDLTYGAWCYYGETATVTPDHSIGEIYGKLYNWYAVMGIENTESVPPTPEQIAARKVFAPEGYHVPNKTELDTLAAAAGGFSLGGDALKEAGNAHFATLNTTATNSTGFTFLPGGQRGDGAPGNGQFVFLYYNGGIWSSTLFNTTNAYRYLVQNDTKTFERNNNVYHLGRSVRLMKDAPLPEVTIASAESNADGSIAVFKGTIVSGLGISVSGFCYAISPEIPTTLSNKTTNGGTVIGPISSTVIGLLYNTTYNVVSYATNSTGTSYSSVIPFLTNKEIIDLGELVIGSQIWATKNLNTTTYLGTSLTIPTAYYRDYNNDPVNSVTHGKLYRSPGVAKDPNIAPQGWRVPTNTDFTKLTTELLGQPVAGAALKDTAFWISNVGATNSTEWTGRGGGSSNGVTFTNFNIRGNYWTSSSNLYGNIYYYLSNSNTTFTPFYSSSSGSLLSIRLMKSVINLYNNPVNYDILVFTVINITPEELDIIPIYETGVCWSTSPNPTIANDHYPLPTDTYPIAPYPATTPYTTYFSGLTAGVDYYFRSYQTEASTGTYTGKTYYGFNNFFTAKANTITGVVIGSQIWQSSNAYHTKYANGVDIPLFTGSNAQWVALTTGAYCYPNNDINLVASRGLLYNWYAVNDSRGFAPTGWRVASSSDFTTLSTYLLGTAYAGFKMKESGKTNWTSTVDDVMSSNSSGFTARPGGYRTTGAPTGSASTNWIWTSNSFSTANAFYCSLVISGNALITTNAQKYIGMSVRLIKI